MSEKSKFEKIFKEAYKDGAHEVIIDSNITLSELELEEAIKEASVYGYELDHITKNEIVFVKK